MVQNMYTKYDDISTNFKTADSVSAHVNQIWNTTVAISFLIDENRATISMYTFVNILQNMN